MGPLRQHLRNATAEAHSRVDAAFGGHDLARRDDYAAFLLGHARVLPGVERALEEAGVESLLPDWSARTRRGALLRDLAALDLGEPEPLPWSPPEGAPALLGAAYVLEGSRLGGALLLRRARAGGDPQVQAATAYLGHGQGQGLWASFLEAIEASGPATTFPEKVVEGAMATFAAFESAALATARSGVEHVEPAR